MLKIGEEKKSKIIIGLFLIQGIIGFVVLSQYVTGKIANWEVNNGLVIVYAVFNIGGIIGAQYIVNLLRKEIQYQKTLVELQRSDEVIVALRGHKHDFFNHLQVISGLAQLGKNDRIISYIQSISHNVSESYEIANIHIPEIAIVLMQKLGQANQKGIKVESQITTTCEGLKGDGIVYAQILFNLLDNAIYELEQIEEEERILRVSIKEIKSYFEFSIYNNLPIIPVKNIELLFKPGFSTKQGEHSGLGLVNVQRLVDANRGSIIVKSRPDYGTAFKIKFFKL